MRRWIYSLLALLFLCAPAEAFTAYDRVAVYTPTTGTGTLSLGNVYCSSTGICPYENFATAGVPTGSSVRYVIIDGTNWETGYGVYTSSGSTLTRVPQTSSSSGSAINLDGLGVVYLVWSAADFNAMPVNIAGFGCSTSLSDNTACINAAIAFCATNYCKVYIPEGIWNITGTLTTGSANIGQLGFGIVGNGIINETSSNLPILTFGNGSGGSSGIQAADFENINLQYSSVQTSADPNSYCMQINFGSAANSLYNSRFGTIQCTNAYRGIGDASSNPGAFWGNRTTVLSCKNNAGYCIDIGNNGASGNDPNNYWGNVYIIPQSTCADPGEITVSFMSNTVFDNIEVNNANCAIFIDPGSNRGVHIRSIRTEVVSLGSGMAGLGLIQCNGGECDVDMIEVQTITINVGAGHSAFIFQDAAGSSGWPTDHVKNVILTTNPTLTSGTLYGYDSPNVGMIVTPVVTYAGPTGYAGDIYPSDNTNLNVGYYLVTQAGTAGSIGTMSNASAFTGLPSLTIPTLNVSSIPSSAGGGGLYVCIDTSGNTYKKSACP